MTGEFYSKEILVVLLSEVQAATEEALRVLSEVKLNLQEVPKSRKHV